MKYADSFCGLGGFGLALKSIDSEAECVWAIDIDKQVSKTFKKNFGIECLGNIREIDVFKIPDHDILFGGFPCQPFSRNGKWFNKNEKKIGNEEDRDNLFLELIRILNTKKPKYFIFENVKGLLSIKNKDGSLYFDTIKMCLESAGYKLYTEILNSVNFGLPQKRERIFFVGIRKDIKQNFVFPKGKNTLTSIEDILENNVSEKYLIINLWKNRKILLQNPKNAKHSYKKGSSRIEVINYLYKNANKPLKPTGKIESVAILYGDTPSGLPRQQDKIYSIKGISPTIATFSIPCVDSNQGLRQLTPRECARLQGIPDNYILPQNDAIAYKQIGNSVAVPVIIEIIKNLINKHLTL